MAGFTLVVVGVSSGAVLGLLYGRHDAATEGCSAILPADDSRTELNRARMALNQAEAARSAVQESANACMNELEQMRLNLRFSRSQRSP